MPGLLRGLVRVAAVAGTATAVSNRVSRRQGRRWSAQEQEQDEQYDQQQQQEAPPPPPAAPARDTVTQLKELAELKTQGVLTDAEFEDQKAKILAS
jgi:putative oligomerization/nucleic acid binding protein